MLVGGWGDAKNYQAVTIMLMAYMSIDLIAFTICRGGQQHLPGSIGYLQTVMNRLNEYANWLGSSV